MLVNKVYKFGCRKSSDEKLALQLLGQAFNYREDLRRVYNSRKQRILDLLKDDASHVLTYLFSEGQKKAQNETIRVARAGRGHLVDYGTYWVVEDAVLAAAKKTKLDPIKPDEWDSTGRIGAAIQSIDKFPASGAWSHPRVRLTEPCSKGYATLTIFVGPLEEQRSITWPVKLHRPFPDGAIVKEVVIQRVRRGWRFRWEALITVEYDEVRSKDATNGVVGVDLGWRWVDGKQRIATASDGTVLWSDALEAFEYADAIRSTRDKNFDEIKAHVKETKLPGWEHAHAWRNKARMVRLGVQTSDPKILDWHYRDRHLEDIEVGVRTRAVRRREDTYRKFADALAKKFRYVVLEDIPISDFVARDETTHAEERRARAASLYILQTAILNRFGKDRVHWTNPYKTSKRCSTPECKGEAVDLGSDEHWFCTKCNTRHQRDENAAINLKNDCERWIGEGKPVRARSRKPKEKEVKKKKSAAVEPLQIEASREPLGNAAE